MGNAKVEARAAQLPEALRGFLEELIASKRLELPMLPDISFQIVNLCRSDSADAAQLTELLHKDHSLAGNVLRIANSPLAGSREAIVSLQQAVSRLGMTRVREIALAASMQGLVFDCGDRQHLVSELWIHCLTTALCGKEVARQLKENVEEAFLCGLLHDMGKPVLLQAVFQFEQQQGERLDNQVLLLTLEHFHAEVAGVLIEAWGLPQSMAEAIACHHDWTRAELARTQAAILSLADHQAHEVQGTSLIESEGYDESVLEELNLYPGDLETLEAKHQEIQAYVEALQS